MNFKILCNAIIISKRKRERERERGKLYAAILHRGRDVCCTCRC